MRSVLWVAAILLVIVGAFVLIIALRAESKVVYRRYFGDYCFEISRNSLDGHPILETSYWIHPQLVRPACGGWFHISDSQKPQFASIHDDEHSLFCVYDTNGWGYMAVVDTKSHKCYAAAPLGYQTRDTVDWQDEYDLLKAKHPDIPHIDVLERDDLRR